MCNIADGIFRRFKCLGVHLLRIRDSRNVLNFYSTSRKCLTLNGFSFAE